MFSVLLLLIVTVYLQYTNTLNSAHMNEITTTETVQHFSTQQEKTQKGERGNG